MSLPGPPILKTTIIQLNRDLDSDDKNYEILTNDYLNDSGTSSSSLSSSYGPAFAKGEQFVEESNSGTAKKKRRRSSANVDSEELAKRKSETKQLHSIIEKRRRIKINREFEALKYLIPACRSTHTPASTSGKKSDQPSSPSSHNTIVSNSGSASNNGNKIDGMYKLTILKSSVEYILYLHHIIKQQHKLLQQSKDSSYNFEINFAKIPLDVNQYRNIDKEFDFKHLIDFESINEPVSHSPPTTSSPAQSRKRSSQQTFDIVEEEESSEEDKAQLPSPDITPDMAPILSLLNKFNTNTLKPSSNPIHASPLFASFSYPGTANVSPLTNPLKSNNFITSAPHSLGFSSNFTLPDPAMSPNDEQQKQPKQEQEQQQQPQLVQSQSSPKKKLFKSKIPQNNTIVVNRPLTIKSTSMEDIRKTLNGKLSEQDASNTLLALRKSSIDSLLN
ncbi:transcriptional regulator of yeast form adherence 6 [[Candida] railenensis]|uniref:Transcriptional regulator of yeast form adherence 6 n=1 Tax=[Candida] railenensis TaxID=45579 RepID=A0A9P0VWK9_9ASCO|nr:transcriptional regulator of yeast form adherence 6 [[Candida] railenensis]